MLVLERIDLDLPIFVRRCLPLSEFCLLTVVSGASRGAPPNPSSRSSKFQQTRRNAPSNCCRCPSMCASRATFSGWNLLETQQCESP